MVQKLLCPQGIAECWVNSKWFKRYHIHKELHKHLNFHGKFDLEGQGQGHNFQTRPKPLDDQ